MKASFRLTQLRWYLPIYKASSSLQEPTLTHLFRFAISSEGRGYFILSAGISFTIVIFPLILRCIFKNLVWNYRKLQYIDARGRIFAGHEECNATLERVLGQFNKIPNYTSAWKDEPFNTQKHEEQVQEQISEEDIFALFDEYEDVAHNLPDRDAFEAFPEAEED